jgi:hypothetical protein
LLVPVNTKTRKLNAVPAKVSVPNAKAGQ